MFSLILQCGVILRKKIFVFSESVRKIIFKNENTSVSSELIMGHDTRI